MVEIDSRLLNVLKNDDLSKIRPIVYLYRNKWDSETSKYVLDAVPIKLKDSLIKVSALTQQLDISEISEYKTSNVTLTFTNLKNEWDERFENSLFADPYKLFGSRIELYAGTSIPNSNGTVEEVKTKLFSGIIQTLPNFAPESYKVDIQAVSSLELLKKIDANKFSDTVLGDSLAGVFPEYLTDYYGVGRIDAVYAGTDISNKVKLEPSQWKADLSNVANKAIINIEDESLSGKLFWADYIIWKRDLQIHQVVNGLLDFTEFTEDKRKVETVIFKKDEQGSEPGSINLSSNIIGAFGYAKNESDVFEFSGWPDSVDDTWNRISFDKTRNPSYKTRHCSFNKDFVFNFNVSYKDLYEDTAIYAFGDEYKGYSWELWPGFTVTLAGVKNGFIIELGNIFSEEGYFASMVIWKCVNGVKTQVAYTPWSEPLTLAGIRIVNDILHIFNNQGVDFYSGQINFDRKNFIEVFATYAPVEDYTPNNIYFNNFKVSFDASQNIIPANATVYTTPFLSALAVNPGISTWVNINGTINPQIAYKMFYEESEDDNIFSPAVNIDFGSNIGNQANYLRISITPPTNISPTFSVSGWLANYGEIGNLFLPIVSLGDLTIYEAIQQLALLSAYEFGIDRDDNFFFRSRFRSTQPIKTLTDRDIVKISSVKKDIKKLINKVKISFEEDNPIEITTSQESHPNSVDLYGEMLKELDRPELLTYANIGLAEYIAGNILNTFGETHNEFQLLGTLDLSADLGKIYAVHRTLSLSAPKEATEYEKFKKTQTFYGACKIIGLSHNIDKRQTTYTFMDITKEGTAPINIGTPFVYELAEEFD